MSSIIVLLRISKEKLGSKQTKDMIHEMYKEIDLQGDWKCLMFFPVWLFRRILYIAVPYVIFPGIKWAQILSLLYMQLFYFIFYGVNRCHRNRFTFLH